MSQTTSYYPEKKGASEKYTENKAPFLIIGI